MRRMSQSSNGVSERAGRAIRPLGDFGVSKMPELPGHAPDSAGAQMAAEKCDHTHRSGTEAGRGWAPWRGTDRQTDRGRERQRETEIKLTKKLQISALNMKLNTFS